MDSTATPPTDSVRLLESLTVEVINARLDGRAREEKALRTLLRAVRHRERRRSAAGKGVVAHA
jgi:hypothetical protein